MAHTVVDNVDSYQAAMAWFADSHIIPKVPRQGAYALCYLGDHIAFVKIKWSKCKWKGKICQKVGCEGKLVVDGEKYCCCYGNYGLRNEFLIYPVSKMELAVYLL
jgi:hypothetical protein